MLEDIADRSSETAFRALYYTYSNRIMRYVMMYVHRKEIAEELTSDVFVAIWENRKQLKEIIDFDAYIYRIAKYKCLNYLRVEQPQIVNSDELPIDLFAYTETTPEDDYINRETIERVNQAIELLPPKCKIAFKLVREDGMKYREAADHLNISIKTLEAHLSTAMKTIMKIMNKD
ncbi:MAG: RNA polymerase sigma-70 factor [Tannerella sp.]|jgi:RNA polymerase sigma-70 factor (ECF subfamily)|nr:RNA polymerase sigma-70 factor [Tannerella sp.]